jgi:hypothetical protein
LWNEEIAEAKEV